MSQANKGKKECRFCALLEASIWEDKEYFRCKKGRFDDKYGTRSFTWQGVWRPNQTVKAAQKDCPCFRVYSRVKLISRKGRM